MLRIKKYYIFSFNVWYTSIESENIMYQLSLLFMKFLIFSMFGYVAEMIMCFIVNKKLTNRGFLCGPVIPIYGVGSICLTFILTPFKESPLLVFLLGMILTTSLEYLTSYVLEKIFHNKWWDYSDQKFNIEGRICLLNAFLFGVGSVFIIYFANPWLTRFLLQFKDIVLIIVAICTFVIFLLDVLYSVAIAYSLRNRLIIVENLKNEKLAKIPGLLEKMIAKQLKNIHGFKKYPSRLLKAFPTIFKSNQKEFDLMKKIALKEKALKKKMKAKRKKKK